MQIGDIATGNTTAIYAAIDEAARAMRGLTAPTRHLVLLTDGMEQGFHDYGPLLDGLRADNIHLSTIGVGRDVSRDFLIRLARDGMGRYSLLSRRRTCRRSCSRRSTSPRRGSGFAG